ncbi:MAG: hypothetical protein U0075_17520 [Thermomicrobiales bacterium]|jgi:uncharacterized protein YneF (UPF0154 family)
MPVLMNRPAPLLAIQLPVPAPIASGVIGGMLIAGVLFWIVENVFHDEHHELAAIVCLAIGLVGGIFLYRYISG